MATFSRLPNESRREPAAWLAANIDLLPPGGTVLDVAAGAGRHAVFLARHGWRVHAVDRDAAALADLRQAAERASVADLVTTECRDLEMHDVSFGAQCYEAVVVVHYLHRALMPAIVAAVAPGGVLVYETFTIEQASRGRPSNPAFLLQPGELHTLVRPLRVLRSREGEFDGKFVASVVAMR
jgi:16S rRNA C967 or C1407 C5-methylase (RsmB/RsmF family)